MSLPVSISSGQLCTRSLSSGTALVGVMALPTFFVPEEGAPYLLMAHAGQLGLVPEVLKDVPPLDYPTLHSISDMARAPIWPKTTTAQAQVVRFIAAFPEANTWAVLGVSAHLAPPGAPDHRWQAIEDGQVRDIPAPVEGRGQALAGLLTEEAVWPGPDGDRYRLSQLMAAMRPVYLRYHRLLAQATRDPALAENLKTLVRTDPELRPLLGSVDPDYCHFLAAREAQGQLVLDGPLRASEVASRQAEAAAVIEILMREPAGFDRDDRSQVAPATPSVAPRPRRSP